MRILIVEDYPPVRAALSTGLSEAGFAIDATGDGTEAWWFITNNNYDVIILDVMLPGIDGLELLTRLRGADNTAHVLMLTAKDTLDDRIAGLNHGADDYLVKPFAFTELLARVRALVRRAYQRKNPVIRVADMEINTSARTVSRHDEGIELTAREYMLLEYFALRQQQVLSRTDIWDHLYDFHSEANSNVVDVYIGYLRKKIERDGWTKLIHTRRGQGYLFGECP